MVEFIVGEKGRGKTTKLIDRANKVVKDVEGSVVFLDRDNNKMFDLDRNIRLVNLANYNLKNNDNFLGFVSGLVSQNSDIEYVFVDGFLNVSKIDVNATLEDTVNELEDLSDKFNITFVLSVSRSKEEIPDTLSSKIVLAL
ncbi:MAG: twitching motility protein PilT [Lachnospiraceae bacterium]|nr:twitching motility protein PilT [Lachnospiraceae bacterium]